MPARSRAKAPAQQMPAQGTSSTPAKRGRPAKTADVNTGVETVAELPKKRGRPAKAKTGEAAAPATTARKRGRPSKTASSDLSRVAGSPRVTKSSGTARTAKAAASRLNPLMRSKLRTRVLAVPKVQAAEPAKPARRGRPPKSRKDETKKAVALKVTKPAQSKAPRKRRGFTMLEVPDRFRVQMQQLLQELYDAEASDVATENEDEEEQGQGQELSGPEEEEDASEQEQEAEQQLQEEEAVTGEHVSDGVNGEAASDDLGEEVDQSTSPAQDMSDSISDSEVDLDKLLADESNQVNGMD